MLEFNPNKRYTASECLAHPWFKTQGKTIVDQSLSVDNLKNVKSILFHTNFAYVILTLISSKFLDKV